MMKMAMSVAAVLCVAASAPGGSIDLTLSDRLDSAAPTDVISTLVYLDEQVAARALERRFDAERRSLGDRHQIAVEELQSTARVSQPPLLAVLEAGMATGRVTEFEPFWIVNAVRVEAQAGEIRRLAARPDVAHVYPNYAIETVAPVDSGSGAEPLQSGVQPGVQLVRAPEVWALGYTGAGVLVSVIDSGVDGSHEALASRWAGLEPQYTDHPEWAWFDPYLDQNTFPYDDQGHGTHVMGSVCGGAPGLSVGVAPGAKWIAAGAIDRGGAIANTVADAIESMQWIVDPDGDPGTMWDVPATCSNSWGVTLAHGYPECDDLFWSFLDNVEATGCVIIFAAGNEGSAGLRRPSDRATDEYTTLAVAAVNANVGGSPIASFSSRGPTACTPDGSTAIKPDIAAPGVSVLSSATGGGYITLDGTSMATPHINGVIALMREANPDLTVTQIKEILYQTSSDLGTPGEDNSYGNGLVDAYEAVQAALSTVALTFSFPTGFPEFIDPNGGTEVEVVVSGQANDPAPGSGMLFYSTGGPYTAVALAEDAPNQYRAVFPAFDCGDTVTYYFTAETTGGELAHNPFTSPDQTYSAMAYSGVIIPSAFDMEVDDGWIVNNVDLTGGGWDRGIPAGGGDREDPSSDFDGSGQCWVTENLDGNSDVDGGPTSLTSPMMDATNLPDAMISYARWFNNDDLDIDTIRVEITADGSNWFVLEEVGHQGQWKEKTFRIADYLTPSTEMQLRFVVVDNPNNSVTEAGVDAVRIWSFFCDDPSILGDVDGDGDVDFDDVVSLLADWGPCPGCPADFNGDDLVGFDDLVTLLANYTS